MATPTPDPSRYQQFEQSPYPDIPLDQSPAADVALRYRHSLTTAFYRRDRAVVSSSDRAILDVGCGTGYTTLTLALANPGAKIVGIDPSPASIAIAQERLRRHGFEAVEFHTLGLEDLPSLGQGFDYINCDEVLYLLPDPPQALAQMKAALTPQGILRTNLHSALQRVDYYRGQRVFELLGVQDEVAREEQVDVVRTVMEALPDWIDLKQKTWSAEYAEASGDQIVRMNYLLEGDRGFTVPEMFTLLNQGGLHFIDMVYWQQWDLLKLLGGLDNLPMVLGLSLSSLNPEQLLTLFELIHPIHRLLDFWCSPVPATTTEPPALSPTTHITLHPQFATAPVRETILDHLHRHQPIPLHACMPIGEAKPRFLDGTLTACLLPLWDGPQTLTTLAQRWQTLHPCDPVTLTPLTPAQAQAQIGDLLSALTPDLYLLVE